MRSANWSKNSRSKRFLGRHHVFTPALDVCTRIHSSRVNAKTEPMMDVQGSQLALTKHVQAVSWRMIHDEAWRRAAEAPDLIGLT